MNSVASVDWNSLPNKEICKLQNGLYALRLADKVSDLVPSMERVFGDKLLTLEGFYNKREMCVGYLLHFRRSPKIWHTDFYLIADYVKGDNKPSPYIETELTTKASSSKTIILSKFGMSFNSRLYTFIYRQKRE